jgi:hypothetical protein
MDVVLSAFPKNELQAASRSLFQSFGKLTSLSQGGARLQPCRNGNLADLGFSPRGSVYFS